MSDRIHTLGDDSNADQDSDDGRQGFFVGGSDRSGQEVLGPRGENSDYYFEAIRQAGAERMTQEATESGSTGQQTTVVVRLVFWNNGFTVDDGPLRKFQDPNNQEFLRAVMSKRIPVELTMGVPGREIDLRIEKKSADYEPPKTKPFSGQGHQLGTS